MCLYVYLCAVVIVREGRCAYLVEDGVCVCMRVAISVVQHILMTTLL
jgi:hypothetical protein